MSASLEQGLDFRSKHETVAVPGVNERLDADLVPRQKKSFIAVIPDGKGEHADETLDTIRPLFLIQMQQDLRIRLE